MSHCGNCNQRYSDFFASSNIPLRTVKIRKKFNRFPSFSLWIFECEADCNSVKLSVTFNNKAMVLFHMVEFPLDSSQVGSGFLAARKSKVLGVDIKRDRNKKSFLARNLSAKKPSNGMPIV